MQNIELALLVCIFQIQQKHPAQVEFCRSRIFTRFEKNTRFWPEPDSGTVRIDRPTLSIQNHVNDIISSCT